MRRSVIRLFTLRLYTVCQGLCGFVANDRTICISPGTDRVKRLEFVFLSLDHWIYPRVVGSLPHCASWSATIVLADGDRRLPVQAPIVDSK
jgi:hypothetical protein